MSSDGDMPPGAQPLPAKRPGVEGSKRAQNRLERIQTIQDAGLQLFLARGLEAVTIDEVVRDAGIAKGSFYRYFADKEALLEAVFSPLASVVDSAFARCTEATARAAQASDPGQALLDAYRMLAEEIAAGVLTHPEATLLYLQENRGPAVGARTLIRELSDRVLANAVIVATAAQDHGLLRQADPRMTGTAVVGMVEQTALRILRGEELGDIATLPDDLISLVLEGLGRE